MATSPQENTLKTKIFTIPNLLSFFRILLIPVIILLYCHYKNYIAAVIVVAISGLTDVVDGKIARRFNMVSELGKVLDPVTDKLTQAALIICLIPRRPWMLAIIALFAVKEIFQLVCGYITLKRTNTVNAADWYGKLCTASVYVIMIILFLFPNIPDTAANILMAICGGVLTLSLVMFIRFYYKLWHSPEYIESSKK